MKNRGIKPPKECCDKTLQITFCLEDFRPWIVFKPAFFLAIAACLGSQKKTAFHYNTGWLRKGFSCHGLLKTGYDSFPYRFTVYVNCYNPNKANFCHCSLGPILRHPKEPITPSASSRPIMVASMTSSTTWLERWRVSGLGLHSTGVFVDFF